jgi:hypothetical protein
VASQDSTLALALRVLESAPGPRTTVQNPLRWTGPADWRQDYLNTDRLSAEEIAQRRAANDQVKAVAQQVRQQALARHTPGQTS